MEAGKAADAYGLFEGHTVEQCDAEQAYIQSKLGGEPTWVRLPRERWPEDWIKRKLRDPVCPLVLALYGHPDSGGYWEKHCNDHLKSVGFMPVEGWRSCFFNDTLKLFVVVYVDDFKLAGPPQGLTLCWKLISKGLKIGDPEPTGLYLGCKRVLRERPRVPGGPPLRCIEYNMDELLASCMDRYKELAPGFQP